VKIDGMSDFAVTGIEVLRLYGKGFIREWRIVQRFRMSDWTKALLQPLKERIRY